MKKYLSQGIFFLSIFGIILVVLNVSVRKKSDYVLRFKPSQVESVSIASGDSVIRLDQNPSPDGPVWMVSADGQTVVADEKAAQTYLAYLARIGVEERFAATDFADEVSRNRIGLGQLGKIAVKLKSGKVLDLQLGQLAPSGTEMYAAGKEQPGTIFTISNGHEKKLLPDFMGLRSRQVFPLTDVQSVALTFADVPITLTPKDTQGMPVIRALRALVYINYFPAVAEGDIAGYGLTLPDIVITLTHANGTQDRYDLSRYSGRCFLRRNAAGPQDVLVLTDQSGSDLLKVLKEFVVHRRAG